MNDVHELYIERNGRLTGVVGVLCRMHEPVHMVRHRT